MLHSKPSVAGNPSSAASAAPCGTRRKPAPKAVGGLDFGRQPGSGAPDLRRPSVQSLREVLHRLFVARSVLCGVSGEVQGQPFDRESWHAATVELDPAAAPSSEPPKPPPGRPPNRGVASAGRSSPRPSLFPSHRLPPRSRPSGPRRRHRCRGGRRCSRTPGRRVSALRRGRPAAPPGGRRPSSPGAPGPSRAFERARAP